MKKLFAVLAVASFATGCTLAPPGSNGEPMLGSYFIADQSPRQVLESLESMPGCGSTMPQGRYYDEDKTFKLDLYPLAYGIYPMSSVFHVFKGRPVEGGTQVDVYTRQKFGKPEALEYINRVNTGSCD